MNLFERAKAAYSVFTGRYLQPTQGMTATVTPGGIVVWQGQNAASLIDDGYCGNDLVYACINLIQKKAEIAPFDLYKIVDKKSYKELKALQAQAAVDGFKYFHHIDELQKKALEPFEGYDPLKERLTNANDEDTFADLINQWVGFKISTGNQFLYAPRIEAGVNKGKPAAFYSTPAQYMSIKADTTVFPAKALSYQLYYGLMWEFNREDIVHDRSFNPKFNANGQELYGFSPLSAAARNITRSNEAKKSTVASFKNGGPAMVMYMDDPRYDSDDMSAQAAKLKESLQRFSGADNRNKIATSPYKVGATQLGLSPVDLDIINAEKWDLRALCNILGIPSQLMNDPDNKSYNNSKEGEKALTSRAVLPHLVSIRENLNRAMVQKWGYKGDTCIDFDMSVYPELQEDKAAQWGWIEKLPITLGEKLNMMGVKYDASNPIYNEIYIPTGLQPIDNLNNMLPNTGDYRNE